MSNKVKELRGQVRIAVKEILGDVLSAELVGNVKKNISDDLSVRLDSIEAYCKDALERSDKRARAVQGFIVQSARQQVNEQLFNMNVTLTAWEEVLGEKLGDLSEFNSLVDARKVIVADRIKAASVAKMESNIKSDAVVNKEGSNVEA